MSGTTARKRSRSPDSAGGSNENDSREPKRREIQDAHPLPPATVPSQQNLQDDVHKHQEIQGASPPLPATVFSQKNLQDDVQYARSSQYHRHVFSQLGLVLEFIVDPRNTNTVTRMVFVFQLQLAIASMNTWKEIEVLVHETCGKYPEIAKSILRIDYGPSLATKPQEVKAIQTEWQRLQEYFHYAQSSLHQRRVLSQLGILLDFIVDDQNSNTADQKRFVSQLRIAILGMDAWIDIEALVYETCHRYPAVWRRVLSPESTGIMRIDHKPSYHAACRTAERTRSENLVETTPVSPSSNIGAQVDAHGSPDDETDCMPISTTEA